MDDEHYADNLSSTRLFYDWNHIDYLDISDCYGLSMVDTVSGLREVTDTAIAGNAYLLTSDIILSGE
jgi:hypothetical protein